MASTSNGSISSDEARAILQENTQKRSASEQLSQDVESKRQKEMFETVNENGPVEITYSSSSVNLDTLEQEQSGDAIETSLVPANDTFIQTHTDQLKVFVVEKEREINALLETIKGLQLKLDVQDHILSENELEKEKFILIDSNTNKEDFKEAFQGFSDNGKIVAKLTSELMEKQAKIRILSMKMMQLQDKIFSTVNHSFELSKNYKSSADFVQESFKLIFPLLYPDLQIKHILKCREVCRSWRDTTDMLLNTHPSTLPFDKDTYLKETEIKELERARMPTWNESPLKKLIKAYKISSFEELQTFSDHHKGTIIGSTVCLDKIHLTNGHNVKYKLARFLKPFDIHINFLIIRECVKLPEFELKLLMDRVKQCLTKLRHLQRLKLVFCIDKYKLNGDALEDLGNTTCASWQPSCFPELESLECLEFQVEISETWIPGLNALQYFTKRLTEPYSKQLKQLSIFTRCLDPSDVVVFPNLVQLSLPEREIKGKFICQFVKKCTIINYKSKSTSEDFIRIQTMFPKLICLGFKFEYVGADAHASIFHLPPVCRNAPFPKFPNVITLELENCGLVEFVFLNCFPNLCYLKLNNKHTINVQSLERRGSNDFRNLREIELNRYRSPLVKNNLLEITKLWQGVNLYECHEFWEAFPNILLVSLEICGEPMQNRKPRFYKWTRENYAQFKN